MIEKYLNMIGTYGWDIVSEDKINSLRQCVIIERSPSGAREDNYVLNEIDGKIYTEEWDLVFDGKNAIVHGEIWEEI